MIARRYLVPVRRRFPILRYLPSHWDADDLPDVWEWVPDWYESREFATLEAANEFVRRAVEQALGQASDPDPAQRAQSSVRQAASVSAPAEQPRVRGNTHGPTCKCPVCS